MEKERLFSTNNPEQADHEKWERIFAVVDRERWFEAVRSSGKGGQNVNKVATKVQLRWHIGGSQIFSDEEKEKIRQAVANSSRYNKEKDELILESQDERYQPRNKKNALEKFHRLLQSALVPEKERIPTKPRHGAKEKRLEEKRKRGEKKKLRQEKIEY